MPPLGVFDRAHLPQAGKVRSDRGWQGVRLPDPKPSYVSLRHHYKPHTVESIASSSALPRARRPLCADTPTQQERQTNAPFPSARRGSHKHVLWRISAG